jgi:hypothetical protein
MSLKAFQRIIRVTRSVLIALCVSVSLGSSGVDAQENIEDAARIVSARDLDIRGELAHLSFSPANPDIIAFESIEGGTLHRLWMLDISSGAVKQISPRYDEEAFYDTRSDRDIHWCPVSVSEKNWFLFVSSGYDGIENIYMGNTVDSIYMQLTSDYAVDHHPRWSPDCRTIVYVSSRSGNGDIYKIDNVTRLIKSFEQVKNDVDRHSDDAKVDIIVDGSEHSRLTTNPEMDSYPEWSPDGRFIVYQGLVRTDDVLHIDLFLLDVNNPVTDPVNITNDTEWDIIQPQWSYDQKAIAYYMSPVGMDDIRRGLLYLSYLEIEEGNPNELKIRKRPGYIDVNVKRSVNTGPFWGPGSRSLVYVKGEGTYTPILYFRTDKDSTESSPVILRESSVEVINREIAGIVDEGKVRIAYLTYEDQDYRVYLVNPVGDILGHRVNDIYVRPYISPSRSYTFLASAALLGVHGQRGPGMVQMSHINELTGYYFTQVSRSSFGSIFEPGIKIAAGQLRSGYLSNVGVKTSFAYSYIETSAIASFPVRTMTGTPRVFVSAGVGYGVAARYALRASGWKSYYIPITLGVMYTLIKHIDIIPYVSLRRIHYSAYGQIRTVLTGTFGLGVAYTIRSGF